MKTLDVGQADLSSCVLDAQSEPIVLTRAGIPIALILGVDGMDREQVELGTSAEFWSMIQDRRRQPTLNRAELESRLNSSD